MNYLVHLSLSYPYDRLVPGNFVFDLLNYQEAKSISPVFQQGIKFHKWIDHFSNNHHALRSVNLIFHDAVHKYAPVVSDIVADHIIYLHWQDLMPLPFDEFENHLYDIISSSQDLMPLRVKQICSQMIAHRWLSQYKTKKGLEEVFNRLNNRLRFPTDLTRVLPVLHQQEEEIQLMVCKFFRDCQKEAVQWINLQSEMKS